MFTSIISNTKWCHSVGYPCNLIGTCVVYFWRQMSLPLLFYQNWLDVLPYLPNWQMLLPCVWLLLLNNLFGCFCGQMLCPAPSVTDVVGITSAHKNNQTSCLTKVTKHMATTSANLVNMAIHPANFGKTTMTMTSAFKNKQHKSLLNYRDIQHCDTIWCWKWLR